VDRFRFPKWTNTLLGLVGMGALAAPLYAVGMIWYGFSPITTDVGYQPEQPIPFSHAVHAGELGIDCRYCHNTVERADKAAIPPTQTCMNCHNAIQSVADTTNDADGTLGLIQNKKLQPLIDSYRTGLPIKWRRVHDLPDYAYFSHQAHIARGVSCVECHGRVDRMEVVYQFAQLDMGWCLDCHRHPETRLRTQDNIFNLASQPLVETSGLTTVEQLMQRNELMPSSDCSTCHR